MARIVAIIVFFLSLGILGGILPFMKGVIVIPIIWGCLVAILLAFLVLLFESQQENGEADKNEEK